MECFALKEIGYQIILIYNEYILKLYIKDNKNNKFRFKPLKLIYETNFSKYISNFKDLINQINNQKILIKIKEHFVSKLQYKPNESTIVKYLEFIFVNNNNIIPNKHDIIISRNIYVLNVEYYLTKGINNERINSKPFLSYLTKDYINRDDIIEIIDKEKILYEYIIDDFKYFDNNLGIFKSFKNDNIQINEKIILEFHIIGKNKILYLNLKLAKEYYENEIIKIKNKINKLADSSKKYDLIYLFASPIIYMLSKGDFEECDSPISYMNEIRIILELMKNNRKQFNCKFECIGKKLLEDVIINNKTKILHISSHGTFDGKNYSLIIENLGKYGEKQAINYKELESILKSGQLNISKIDLVILTICHSEDFGKLFLKYGAKNVIYIDRKTKIIDRISVLFVKYFYQNILEGKSIEESYIKTLESMKLNKEIIKINNGSCCCQHYHINDCALSDEGVRKRVHTSVHYTKIDNCQCNYKTSNCHKEDCEYVKLFEKNITNKGTNKKINIEEKIRNEDNIFIIM